MADRNKLLVTFLVLVIVILVAIVAFTFLVKPAVTGYAIDKQGEGVQIAITQILAQVQQNGFVQIPVGNQTLFLMPFDPQQAQQPVQ